MNQLAKFLSGTLKDYGRQVSFAQAIGSSPGTVSKWLSGENSPNFESCLRIASYFEIDPARVFRMAGKVGYYRLYAHFFQRSEIHAELHRSLQSLLDAGLEGQVESALEDVANGSMHAKKLGQL